MGKSLPLENFKIFISRRKKIILKIPHLIFCTNIQTHQVFFFSLRKFQFYFHGKNLPLEKKLIWKPDPTFKK